MSKNSKRSITSAFGVFADLGNVPQLPPAIPAEKPAEPVERVGAGVIGATKRSMTDIRVERDQLKEQLKNGGLAELDPLLIDPSPFADRLADDDPSDFEAFRASFDTEGQKVPIQVRIHPHTEGRYQVAYGHRRLRAARELGRLVKASIVDLTDEQLAIAQGLENAARQDLSWIERALFVARMDDVGIKARDIGAALSVDRAELAKLRSVTKAVPLAVLERIGRAPKIGRPRWLELANAINDIPDALSAIETVLSDAAIVALPSDDRFTRIAEALLAAEGPVNEARRQVSETLETANGLRLGTMSVSANGLRLALEKKYASAFSQFLKAELPGLLAKFEASEGTSKP